MSVLREFNRHHLTLAAELFTWRLQQGHYRTIMAKVNYVFSMLMVPMPKQQSEKERRATFPPQKVWKQAQEATWAENATMIPANSGKHFHRITPTKLIKYASQWLGNLKNTTASHASHVRMCVYTKELIPATLAVLFLEKKFYDRKPISMLKIPSWQERQILQTTMLLHRKSMFA